MASEANRLTISGQIAAVRVVSKPLSGASAQPAPTPPSAPPVEKAPPEPDDRQRGQFDLAWQAMRAAADRLDRLAKDLAERAEMQLLDLAVQIARKILQQDVQAGRHEIEPIVHAAMSKVSFRQDVVVHLNPKDWERCELVHPAEGQEMTHVRFVSNPQVPPAGCIVETPEGLIESSIEQQLQEVRRELTGQEAAACPA